MFIPFNGCPHRCSFCDQRSITGAQHQPSPAEVQTVLEIAVDSLKENTYHSEIAFFGGSFTAIDRGYMRSLLEATVPYIDRFKGIRISTRPDAIDGDILSLLRAYHVTSVELGAQSMSDRVLSANDRGHTAQDVRYACALIRDHGMELGLQMMTGLYQSSDEQDIATAQAFIALRPDTVRIYPTIVMRHTRLDALYQQGLYQPQSLDGAVSLCSRLIPLFEAQGIRVIRVGLHDSESLAKDRLAGPYHPAFRELCESRIMFDKAVALLRDKAPGAYTLRIAPRSRSRMTGHKRANLLALQQLGYTVTIQEDTSLHDREILLLP